MKNIRRYYFYIVSIVSLEVVIWASVFLIRSIFSSEEIGRGTNQLATALSYILVAIPVFLIHWNWVRRDVKEYPEQRAGGTRAFFLYFTSIILWVPAVQNLIAIILRLISNLMGTASYNLAFGANQNFLENFAGLLVNLVFALYVQKVIREDHEKVELNSTGEYFRKIYWYLIALYPLVLTFFGLEKIIYYILIGNQQVVRTAGELVNGLGMILVGLPLWAWLWMQLNKRFDKNEEPVLVRQVFLTAQYMTLLLVMFTTTTILIGEIANDLFAFSETGNDFAVVAYLMPAVIFWIYFNQLVNKEASIWNILIKHIYLRVMTLISLVSAFTGIALAGWNLLELLTGNSFKNSDYLKNSMIEGFALFLVWGLVWWIYWRPRNERDEEGYSQTQKLIERIYQYLVVGAGVIGGMVSAAGFLYVIIRALLEGTGTDFTQDLLTSLYLMILFAFLLFYHLRFLRKLSTKEDVVEERAIVEVLSFEPFNGFNALISHLAGQDKKIEVIIHNTKDGLPGKNVDISIVFLGAEKASNLNKTEEKFFASFKGNVVVIPEQKDNWYFLGTGDVKRPSLEVNVIKLITGAASGEELSISPRKSVWEIFGYLFAVVAGVGFLCVIANILIEVANGF